jgi:hypothetical protein
VLDQARDYILKMPSTPVRPGSDGGIWISGGHNIVLIGGELDFDGVVNTGSSEKEGRAVTILGTTGTVHIEGLWAHGDGLVEGVQGFAPQATLQLENCRFDHLHTTGAALHSDLVQWNDGGDLRINRFTGSSEYQGIFRANHSGMATISAANLVGLPGSADPSPRLLWQGSALPMTLDNVWVSPRPGQSPGMAVWPDIYADASVAAMLGSGYLSWGSASGVTGRLSVGAPSGGDFVPAGLAGTSYTSPGYQ